MTTPNQAREIVLATLARINRMLDQDANAVVSTRSGDVAPEQAQVELIREVLNLLN